MSSMEIHVPSLTPIGAEDVMEAVRQTAMLADVTIATWSGQRTDADLLQELKQTHGATGDVGRMIKNLLAGADGLLRDVKSAYTAVRLKHYEMTLPWTGNPAAVRKEGPRLLPKIMLETYLREMGKLNREAKSKLDNFLNEYPDLVKEAKKNLGSMADQTYPTSDQIRSAFNIHLDFQPIPESVNFKGLSPHMFEIMSKNLSKKQNHQLIEAQKEAWARISEPLKHLIERLEDNTTGDKPKKFRDATIENVRSLVTMIPGWNLTGDPQMDEIKADIENLIENLDAAAIRKSDDVRHAVVSEAGQVVRKLAGWGKGAASSASP